MSSKDAHLYNQNRPASRTKSKEISSSSTVAFSSTLSSLIKASSSASASKIGPARSRSKKEDIFSTHNKNVKKRALKDLEDSSFTQKHRGRTAAEKDEDDATWRRTKRRMEEKARLYNALKRGDIEDLDDRYGVDFDSKWAENQDKEEAKESESDSESEQSEEELIEYIDEFGRTRKGTRAEVAREKRKQRTQAADEPDRFTARPSMPQSGIIYGDAVQTEAFNPDSTIAQQMAELAAKRDKELTPPPEVHFDGREEMRQRGTGYFQFSKDEEERRAQMSGLEKEREETEKARRKRLEKIEERKRFIEQKKRAMKEKRAKGKADRFLDNLSKELNGREEHGEEDQNEQNEQKDHNEQKEQKEEEQEG